MERTVSATQARIRFGEVMRWAVEQKESVIVARGGKPYAVVLSVDEYERLRAGRREQVWQAALERVVQIGDQIKRRRKGKMLPPAEEIIRKMREERDEQLTNLR